MTQRFFCTVEDRVGVTWTTTQETIYEVLRFLNTIQNILIYGRRLKKNSIMVVKRASENILEITDHLFESNIRSAEISCCDL